MGTIIMKALLPITSVFGILSKNSSPAQANWQKDIIGTGFFLHTPNIAITAAHVVKDFSWGDPIYAWPEGLEVDASNHMLDEGQLLTFRKICVEASTDFAALYLISNSYRQSRHNSISFESKANFYSYGYHRRDVYLSPQFCALEKRAPNPFDKVVFNGGHSIDCLILLPKHATDPILPGMSGGPVISTFRPRTAIGFITGTLNQLIARGMVSRNGEMSIKNVPGNEALAIPFDRVLRQNVDTVPLREAMDSGFSYTFQKYGSPSSWHVTSEVDWNCEFLIQKYEEWSKRRGTSHKIPIKPLGFLHTRFISIPGTSIEMMERLVTRAEFEYFLQHNPAWQLKPGSWNEQGYLAGWYNEAGELEHPYLPANFVSTKACIAFAQWCKDQEGVPYRLPTTEEWEKATLAGRDDLSTAIADEIDWKRVNYHNILGTPSPPQLSYSNPLGIADTFGNVQDLTLQGNEPIACGGSYRVSKKLLKGKTNLSLNECRRDMGFRLVIETTRHGRESN
ncbi:MAG: SUMF1/EgtB/PvdO family nonheme iron enzyme [Bacteroidia bacterium]